LLKIKLVTLQFCAFIRCTCHVFGVNPLKINELSYICDFNVIYIDMYQLASYNKNTNNTEDSRLNVREYTEKTIILEGVGWKHEEIDAEKFVNGDVSV